jgi:hypothetical protein
VNSFDEESFITSLKVDVERQIRDSGATVNSKGSSDPSGFFIEYAERDIHGRITINGKTSAGGYFSYSRVWTRNQKTLPNQRIVGPERRERVSHQNLRRCSVSCGPVNFSDGRMLLVSLRNLNNRPPG